MPLNKRASLLIAPEMDPIAQHRVLRLFQLHSDPSICYISFALGRITRYELADLLGQLIRHDLLRVGYVQMGQVDQHLPHRLVEHNRVALLHELAYNLSLVVLNNQDLSYQLDDLWLVQR